MTNPKRWLDELPHGSQERELLLVGKAARPAEGALDANWKALCAALGTTAAISGTFATSAAANTAAASASTSVKAGAAVAASKAAGTGLLLVAAKSLAVGVGVGLALMGAATMVERASEDSARPAAAMKRSATVDAPQPPRNAPSIPPSALPDPMREERVASPSSNASGPSPARELGAAASQPQNAVGSPSAVSATSTEVKNASLARQARELAELKRLIDSGASHEALRRLEENFSAGTASVLSEERDALHVQALARAQRRNEARAFARQFLLRYPHSPYFETMRQLLTEE